jgi:DNA mismatch repair protein MutH
MNRVAGADALVLALVERAQALDGYTVLELSRALGEPAPSGGVHTKGKLGELVERALGAHGGPGATVDFPSLGVELKTIPVDETGRPKESTFVCAFRVEEADRAEWQRSWVREKLRRVLFVPVIGARAGGSAAERRFGRALLWSPTSEQDRALAHDFDDIVGLVGAGHIEELDARLGRYLQMRPKARNGSARTVAYGDDGERLGTVPRGFYLRASFTAAVLRDPAALP